MSFKVPSKPFCDSRILFLGSSLQAVQFTGTCGSGESQGSGRDTVREADVNRLPLPVPPACHSTAVLWDICSSGWKSNLSWLPFLSLANRWKQSTPSLVSELYLCHSEHFRWGNLLVMPFGMANYSAFTNTLLFGGCLVSTPAFIFACRQHYSLVGICYSSLQCNKQKLSEMKLVCSHREETQGDWGR